MTGVFVHPHYFVPFQFIAHPLSGINVTGKGLTQPAAE